MSFAYIMSNIQFGGSGPFDLDPFQFDEDPYPTKIKTLLGIGSLFLINVSFLWFLISFIS